MKKPNLTKPMLTTLGPPPMREEVNLGPRHNPDDVRIPRGRVQPSAIHAAIEQLRDSLSLALRGNSELRDKVKDLEDQNKELRSEVKCLREGLDGLRRDTRRAVRDLGGDPP